MAKNNTFSIDAPGWGCIIPGEVVDFSDKKRATMVHCRYMLNRTQSMFDYDGLPETVPRRSLELMEQSNGFVCITKVKDGQYDPENGELYAFYGGLGGEYDAYYMPTVCTVANPALNFNKALEIHKECVIIPNDSLYMGLLPLFNRYATMMAETDLSLWMASINSRILQLIAAEDDTANKSAHEFLTDIIGGKLGVIASKPFLDGIKVFPVGNTADRNTQSNIELKQYLKASGFNDIGLSANYNMKREAINSQEAQMGVDSLLPLVDDMFRCRVEGWKEVEKLFGVNVTPKYNSAWEDRQQVANNPTPDVEEPEPKEDPGNDSD